MLIAFGALLAGLASELLQQPVKGFSATGARRRERKQLRALGSFFFAVKPSAFMQRRIVPSRFFSDFRLRWRGCCAGLRFRRRSVQVAFAGVFICLSCRGVLRDIRRRDRSGKFASPASGVAVMAEPDRSCTARDVDPRGGSSQQFARPKRKARPAFELAGLFVRLWPAEPQRLVCNERGAVGGMDLVAAFGGKSNPAQSECESKSGCRCAYKAAR